MEEAPLSADVGRMGQRARPDCLERRPHQLLQRPGAMGHSAVRRGDLQPARPFVPDQGDLVTGPELQALGLLDDEM